MIIASAMSLPVGLVFLSKGWRNDEKEIMGYNKWWEVLLLLLLFVKAFFFLCCPPLCRPLSVFQEVWKERRGVKRWPSPLLRVHIARHLGRWSRCSNQGRARSRHETFQPPAGVRGDPEPESNQKALSDMCIIPAWQPWPSSLFVSYIFQVFYPNLFESVWCEVRRGWCLANLRGDTTDVKL